MVRLAKSKPEKEKRPEYPKRRTCNCKKQGCGTEPEWEWEGFEDVWTCLGCGMAIIGKTGKDAFAPKQGEGKKTQAQKRENSNKASNASPKHKIYFDGVAASRFQSGWRCKCGYVYPFVPEKILKAVQAGKSGAVYDWLEPLKKEHEDQKA